jgi:hypothetical protein
LKIKTVAESTPRDVHHHDYVPHFFSISGLAKYLKIRREIVRLAIKNGDLKTRSLPGRERPIITWPDKEQWIASLEQTNVRQPHDSPSLLKEGEVTCKEKAS